MKTFTVRNDKGDVFQVDEDKAHQAEADGFLPVVTNGKEEHRVSFADMHKAEADGYASYNDYWEGKATKMADIKADQHPVGVAIRSLGRGLTGDSLDEAVGYLGATVDQLKGTNKTFDESRRAYRDEQRLKQEVDDIEYPGLSTTGRIVGGIALGSKLPGAASFAGSVGYGAAQGLGGSEAEDVKGMLEDAATGGAFGAGGYAAGKVIQAAPSIARNAPTAIKRAANTVGEVTEAVSEGANNKGFMGAVTGPMAGVKKVLEIGGDVVEQRKVAEGFRKALGPGHFRDMTDPEVIALMVSEGNEQAIAYVAQRAGRLSGVDPEEFGKLLKANANGVLHSGPSLEDARNFDFRKAGGELVDDVDSFANQLDLAQKARRSELEGIARNSYSGDTQAILDNLQKQIASAAELRVTSGAKPALSDVYEIVANGKNAEDLGLQAGNWSDFDGPEQFNRLMKARQLLDNEIDWDAIRRKSRSPTAVERKLMQVRGQIDDALKGAGESKIESDAMYGQYAEMQKRVTNKLKADGDFDKYKVGNMLKDTDGANRFRDNLRLLDEFIANNQLDPKAVEAVKSFRDKFAKNLDTAELRRTLQRFETATVGSSRSGRAAQAAESLKRGDNILDELTKAPEQALRTSRNVLKEAEAFFGKPFSQMTQEEKLAIVRFQTEVKKSPNLNFVETAKKWQEKIK